MTFAYDPTGRVKTKQDQAGDAVTYNYDLAGRLTSRVYPSDTDSFTYDAAGRMLSAVSGRYGNTVAYDYDAAGRKVSETQTVAGQDYVTQTSYALAGQVSGYTYPDGTSVARTYSERGQLATIGYDGTVVDTRTYDDGGRMLFRFSSYNNGVSQMRAHDNSACAASIAFSGAPIGSYSYSWDANKNKTAETITGAMSGYSFTTGTTGYDDEDRLTGFTRGTLSQSWNLKSVGDWASFTQNGTSQARTHGPTHELTSVGASPVTHDTKGNITSKPSSLNPTDTSSLAWDFDNRLDAIDVDGDTNVDVTFEYDALGRRVRKNDIIYVLSGQQVIAEYVAGTTAASPTEKYVYASYIDEPVLKDGTGGLQYYHRNQQYSITALTSSTGAILERYAYDACGNPSFLTASGTTTLGTTVNHSYTYTGRRYDAKTGDYFYRARYYDAKLGRFVSRDPIYFVSGTFNVIEYCHSSPVVFVDPFGNQIRPFPAIPGQEWPQRPPEIEDPQVHLLVEIGVLTLPIGVAVGGTRICARVCLSALAKRRAIATATRVLNRARTRLARWAHRVEFLEAEIAAAEPAGEWATAGRLSQELGRAIAKRIELQALVHAARRARECLR